MERMEDTIRKEMEMLERKWEDRFAEERQRGDESFWKEREAYQEELSSLKNRIQTQDRELAAFNEKLSILNQGQEHLSLRLDEGEADMGVVTHWALKSVRCSAPCLH